MSALTLSPSPSLFFLRRRPRPARPHARMRVARLLYSRISMAGGGERKQFAIRQKACMYDNKGVFKAKKGGI